MEQLSTQQVSEYADQAVSLAIQWGPPLIEAILFLTIGLWLIKRFVAAVDRTMLARNVEPTLARFLTSLFNATFKILLLVSVAGMVGIQTTSFIAILGAAGLAIGLAWQGTLANFAGGVLVLLFKPYKVGDFIEAQGIVGSVAEILILNTILKTPDNKVIIVPNGPISNGIITNYSRETTRRVDFVFGIGYDADIATAKQVLHRLIAEEDRVLTDPPPLVVVSELAESCVNLTVRVWVNSPDYSGVMFSMMENVKLAFDQAGIAIPYPQTDVHLHKVRT